MRAKLVGTHFDLHIKKALKHPWGPGDGGLVLCNVGPY